MVGAVLFGRVRNSWSRFDVLWLRGDRVVRTACANAKICRAGDAVVGGSHRSSSIVIGWRLLSGDR